MKFIGAREYTSNHNASPPLFDLARDVVPRFLMIAAGRTARLMFKLSTFGRRNPLVEHD
jgi:hypothetical protein